MKLEPATCAVCDLDDCTPVAVGYDFEYNTSSDEFLAVQCRRCELVYLNPRPSAESLPQAYPDSYHAFQFDEDAFGIVYHVRQRLEANRLLKWCKGIRENAKILDIGCGDGFHMELIRKFGDPTWSIEGVDADPRAAAGAKRRDVSIHCGLVEQVPLEPGTYDRILMIMTIEHLADPFTCLKRAIDLLKPGGRLIIVTDNAGSPDFRIFGNRHWGGYHFPRHLYLFNAKNLVALCARVGLKPISVKTAVSPVNWTYSFLNWIQDWYGPSWISRWLSLESPIALGIFTMIDIPLAWLGRGAILHGVFEKPKANGQ